MGQLSPTHTSLQGLNKLGGIDNKHITQQILFELRNKDSKIGSLLGVVFLEPRMMTPRISIRFVPIQAICVPPNMVKVVVNHATSTG